MISPFFTSNGGIVREYSTRNRRTWSEVV